MKTKADKYYNYVLGVQVSLKIGQRLSYLNAMNKGAVQGIYMGKNENGEGCVKMDDGSTLAIRGDNNIHKWTKVRQCKKT